jgi:hypothetical protein
MASIDTISGPAGAKAPIAGEADLVGLELGHLARDRSLDGRHVAADAGRSFYRRPADARDPRFRRYRLERRLTSGVMSDNTKREDNRTTGRLRLNILLSASPA